MLIVTCNLQNYLKTFYILMQNTIEEKICVKGQMDSLKIVFVLDFKNSYLHILSKFVNNLFTQEIGGVVLPGAEPNPVQKPQNQVSTIYIYINIC